MYKYFLSLILISEIFISHTAVCSELQLVFATPVKEGAADLLRQTIFTEQDREYFLQLGISKYNRWIQKVQGKTFLIHQLIGSNPGKSLYVLREEMNHHNERASALQQVYEEALGIDLTKNNWIPCISPVTELIEVDVDHSEDALIKDYCFIYPLIPSKRDHLLEIYNDHSADYSKDELEELMRSRGISKKQVWIQDFLENAYIVIYQEITGPVLASREQYLNSKNDELSYNISNAYSEITGLSYEELLPNLESLDDFEILEAN